MERQFAVVISVFSVLSFCCLIDSLPAQEDAPFTITAVEARVPDFRKIDPANSQGTFVYVKLQLENPSGEPVEITQASIKYGSSQQMLWANTFPGSSQFEHQPYLKACEIKEAEFSRGWGLVAEPKETATKWFFIPETNHGHSLDLGNMAENELDLVLRVGGQNVVLNIDGLLKKQLVIETNFDGPHNSIPVVHVSGPFSRYTIDKFHAETDQYSWDPYIVDLDKANISQTGRTYRSVSSESAIGVIKDVNPQSSRALASMGLHALPSMRLAIAVSSSRRQQDSQPLVEFWNREDIQLEEQTAIMPYLIAYGESEEVLGILREIFIDGQRANSLELKCSVAQNLSGNASGDWKAGLIELIVNDESEKVRVAAPALLRSSRLASRLDHLVKLIRDPDPNVRLLAIHAITLDSEAAREAVMTAIQDESKRVGEAAVNKLLSIPFNPDFESMLRYCIDHPHLAKTIVNYLNTNSNPSRGLSPVPPSETLTLLVMKMALDGAKLNPLIELAPLPDGSEEIQKRMIDSLITLGSVSRSGRLSSDLTGTPDRNSIAHILGEMKSQKAVPALSGLLLYGPATYEAVPIALGRIGGMQAISALRQVLAVEQLNQQRRGFVLAALVMLGDDDATAELSTLFSEQESGIALAQSLLSYPLDSEELYQVMVDSIKVPDPSDRNFQRRNAIQSLFRQAARHPRLFDMLTEKHGTTIVQNYSSPFQSRILVEPDLETRIRLFAKRAELRDVELGPRAISINEFKLLYNRSTDELIGLYQSGKRDEANELFSTIEETVRELSDEFEFLNANSFMDGLKKSLIAKRLETVNYVRVKEAGSDSDIVLFAQRYPSCFVEVICSKLEEPLNASSLPYTTFLRYCLLSVPRMKLTAVDNFRLEFALAQLDERFSIHSTESTTDYSWPERMQQVIDSITKELLFSQSAESELEKLIAYSASHAIFELEEAQQIQTALLVRLEELDYPKDDLQEERLKASRKLEAVVATYLDVWYPAELAKEAEFSNEQQALIRAAGGVATDQFVLFQSMSMKEFQALCPQFAKQGYVPHRVRPYQADDQVFVSAVFRRSNQEWSYEISDDSAMLQAQNTEMQAKGFLPIEVASYMDGGVDKYLVIWAEERSELGKRYLVVGQGLLNDNSIIKPKETNYFSPVWNDVGGENGGPSFRSIVWREWPEKEGARHFPLMDTSGAKVRSQLSSRSPTEFWLKKNPSGDSPLICGMTRSLSGFQSIFLHSLDTEDQQRRAEYLARSGFLPQAISTMSPTDDSEIVTSISWVRPQNLQHRLPSEQCIIRVGGED